MAVSDYSIAALSAKHQLEPLLRTVIVEGASDRRFYRSQLAEMGHGVVSILEVDAFDLDWRESFGTEVASSNKLKVKAILAELKKAGTSGVLGIIDRDFDGVCEPMPEIESVLRTDYHNMEVYWAVGRGLQSIATRFLPVKIAHSGIIENGLFPALYSYFRLRFACSKAGVKFAGAPMSKNASVDGSALSLDDERLTARVRSAIGGDIARSEFDRALVEFDKCGGPPGLQFVHGRDLVDAIRFVASKCCKRLTSQDLSSKLLERGLMAMCDLESLSTCDMIKSLCAFLDSDRLTAVDT